MKAILRCFCQAVPCVFALVVLSGCDQGKVPGLVKYEGSVTYKGEPLAEAMLYFTPTSGGRGAYATTDAAGHFKVTTIDPDDGIVKGQYKVSVSKYIVVRYTMIGDGKVAETENILPDKYGSEETPLSIDVTAKKFDVVFELTD